MADDDSKNDDKNDDSSNGTDNSTPSNVAENSITSFNPSYSPGEIHKTDSFGSGFNPTASGAFGTSGAVQNFGGGFNLPSAPAPVSYSAPNLSSPTPAPSNTSNNSVTPMTGDIKPTPVAPVDSYARTMMNSFTPTGTNITPSVAPLNYQYQSPAPAVESRFNENPGKLISFPATPVKYAPSPATSPVMDTAIGGEYNAPPKPLTMADRIPLDQGAVKPTASNYTPGAVAQQNQSIDWNKEFLRLTGTKFDPKSRQDRESMAQLQGKATVPELVKQGNPSWDRTDSSAQYRQVHRNNR